MAEWLQHYECRMTKGRNQLDKIWTWNRILAGITILASRYPDQTFRRDQDNVYEEIPKTSFLLLDNRDRRRKDSQTKLQRRDTRVG